VDGSDVNLEQVSSEMAASFDFHNDELDDFAGIFLDTPSGFGLGGEIQ
jgi:hypothetical protein